MRFIFFLAILFVIAAIQLWRGKWTFLIQGYSSLSPKDREAYHARALGKLTAIILLICAFSLCLIALNTRYRFPWVVPLAMALILISGLGGSVYAKTSKRFKAHPTDASLEAEPAFKRANQWALFLCLSLTIGVGILFFFGSQQPKVQISKDSVSIRGLYGTTIDFSDVMSVMLIEESMHDFGTGRRLNGFDAGTNLLRGHFEQGLLFVNAKSDVTLQIRRWEDPPVYISFKKETQTKELYDDLLRHITEAEEKEEPPAQQIPEGN
ncbi:MAG: DUF3784 domain-containing protein [Turicibacter sp.]|nr:DUF3784 domain-containing protein [Turicibacter sp.]